MARVDDAVIDCLVIGGGPAGLTAAIYLARFHLSVEVIDDGCSRASLIPLTRNHAGFPGGISGADLLAKMRAQVTELGVAVSQNHVDRIARRNGSFVANCDGREITARSVLLATGVVNNKPEIADELHERALAEGRLRYCPICDGYEVTDRRVGVIGTGEAGVKEALFLRSYTQDVTLMSPTGQHDLDAEMNQELGGANVAIAVGPIEDFVLSADALIVRVGGTDLHFDSVYPALGSVIRSELAVQLGASVSESGCLLVDAHQRSSVAGLYAAGDVVMGLDQISHAMGEGGVAATTIRNDLANLVPLER